MPQIYIPKASDWLGAYESGREARMVREKQDATRKAGGLMASGDYAGAAAAVFPYDLATGAAIQKMGTERADLERRKGYGQLFAQGKGQEAVSAAFSAGDWDVGGAISKVLDAATESEREAAKAAAEKQAALIAPVGELPYEQRKAEIARIAPDLIAAGYTQEQIAAFDPTDANLARVFSVALGVKDYLSDRRAERKFEADETDRKLDNERADKQLEISRGQLGVSQGNLAQRRAEDAARRQGIGGYAAPGAPGVVLGSTLPEDY